MKSGRSVLPEKPQSLKYRMGTYIKRFGKEQWGVRKEKQGKLLILGEP